MFNMYAICSLSERNIQTILNFLFLIMLMSWTYGSFGPEMSAFAQQVNI